MIYNKSWKYNKLNLQNVDEIQCKREFRFLISHMNDLKSVNVEKTVACNQTVCSWIDALHVFYLSVKLFNVDIST